MGILTRILRGSDQEMFNNLTDEQKLAFCKLASMMAKSDGKVVRDEMKSLPEIPIAFFANSDKLTFSDALEALKSLTKEQKDIIKKELEDMSKDDGFIQKDESNFLAKIMSEL